MAAKQNSFVQGQAASDDIPLTSLEESLLSLEKLDRASPELWPEQIPGVSEFAPHQDANESPPEWNKSLTKEDIAYIQLYGLKQLQTLKVKSKFIVEHQELNTLSTTGLIMEVKKLHDLAYQLGLEEAKEMTRGKYLNIFTSRKPR